MAGVRLFTAVYLIDRKHDHFDRAILPLNSLSFSAPSQRSRGLFLRSMHEARRRAVDAPPDAQASTRRTRSGRNGVCRTRAPVAACTAAAMAGATMGVA